MKNRVVWVNQKNGWQYHRQGELPSGVFTVTAVTDLLSLDFK